MRTMVVVPSKGTRRKGLKGKKGQEPKRPTRTKRQNGQITLRRLKTLTSRSWALWLRCSSCTGRRGFLLSSAQRLRSAPPHCRCLRVPWDLGIVPLEEGLEVGRREVVVEKACDLLRIIHGARGFVIVHWCEEDDADVNTITSKEAWQHGSMEASRSATHRRRALECSKGRIPAPGTQSCGPQA